MSACSPVFLVIKFCLIKKLKRNQTLETLREPARQQYPQLTMNPYSFTASSHFPPPHTSEVQVGGGGKILVGTVVKAKLGELEEEVREWFLRQLRKELSGVVQGVCGK